MKTQAKIWLKEEITRDTFCVEAAFYNGLLKERYKGGIEVTGRQGRRRSKLLDNLKEGRGYSHLKEEALDRTMWRACFGRGFGPVVRQTTKWMNVVSVINEWVRSGGGRAAREENQSTCRRTTTKSSPFRSYHHPASEGKDRVTTNSSVGARVGTFSSTQSYEMQVYQRCHPFRMSLAIRNLMVTCNFYFPTIRTMRPG